MKTLSEEFTIELRIGERWFYYSGCYEKFGAEYVNTESDINGNVASFKTIEDAKKEYERLYKNHHDEFDNARIIYFYKGEL